MILKNFSDLAPELIVWEDICQHDETWSRAAELEEWFADKADAHCESVGFVIAEDNRFIILADSVIESDELYSNVTKIPKSVILKRTPLIEGTDPALAEIERKAELLRVATKNFEPLRQHIKWMKENNILTLEELEENAKESTIPAISSNGSLSEPRTGIPILKPSRFGTSEY